MNFLLEFTKDQFTQEKLPMSEVLSSGLEVVLTGILTVFGVLIILWMALVLFKIFFHDIPSGKSKKPKEVKADPAPVYQAPVASNDEEIIAVIAAAIAMAENECGGTKQFRVVSFKRK